ncbi:hypothetical protein EYC80_005409 [Monilinia laxa]|uniref:Uncharacterized protein n=1 Tax=Monilinia laxa TaxID=61186 RepID=A0A5N6KK51_MONLA|nr:hypothetical protein EYC80_005409 [Monilinia laxa]
MNLITNRRCNIIKEDFRYKSKNKDEDKNKDRDRGGRKDRERYEGYLPSSIPIFPSNSHIQLKSKPYPHPDKESSRISPQYSTETNNHISNRYGIEENSVITDRKPQSYHMWKKIEIDIKKPYTDEANL